MSLYETGTITGALNSTTISGTGTKWSDAKIGITNGSVLFVSSSAGIDGVYQVKRVINDTSIELNQPIYKAFTNAKYSILVSEASSTASFANQLAAALGYYQAQIDGWQQIMTGTGDVELTAPDGTKVTIKSFTALDKNKADVKDVEKLEKDKMSVGAFGLGLKKDSLPDSLNGASGFFGAGSYAVGYSASVVIQSSYGAERRGQFAVNMANQAYFRFCTSTSDSEKDHPWIRLMTDRYRNPVFTGGYLTRESDGSLIEDNYNINGHANALGTRMQIHINLAANDPSAVADYLFVRRPASGTSGQIVVTLPKTGGTLALQGTSGINFKKDISDAEPEEAMNRINALRLVNYIYKDDKNERIRFGIIAEEAEKVAPQYIKHNQEYVDDVIDPVTNEIIEKIYRDRPSVDVNPIVMDLLGAIQVLNSKVNEQEKRLLELEKMKLSMDK